MKGKIGLIVGLGAGYVLGTRAGRERFEQIRSQWLKVWERDEVQDQVDKVKDFAKSQAGAVPGALWNGAVKVVQSVSGSGTPGQKVDSALASGKKAAADVGDAVEDIADEGKKKSDAKNSSSNTSSGSSSTSATQNNSSTGSGSAKSGS
ncbi:hypothetical protein [Microbacterium sp.]|uniref:hypothetical protein n=1 Tax=Microbacterium sp. TaxID=51671 RepID=UPI0028116C33|nr:hypothetical protein [Microbacterium sp.]